MIADKGFDKSSFEFIFREFYEELTRYAFTIVKDAQLSEDVVQSLYIRLWEKRDEMDEIKSIKAYLYRSTYNLSLNEVKKNSRVNSLDDREDLVVSNGQLASDFVESNDLQTKIEGAISELPEKCQEVFRLSRMEEMSYREIANQLQISVKTVENQMGKALKHMRSSLSEYLPELIVSLIMLNGW